MIVNRVPNRVNESNGPNEQPSPIPFLVSDESGQEHLLYSLLWRYDSLMRCTDYDEIAVTYDRRYEEQDYAGIERALIEFVGSRSRVLEVGCGTASTIGTVR